MAEKGWDRYLMMSLFRREAAYDAGVTMSDANACSMKGYEMDVEWPDEIVSDKGELSGYEHGTQQEIAFQGFTATYKEPRAKPNTLAGLAALCLGNITSTQDGALTAYRHKIIPVEVGTALPSIQLEQSVAGVQHAYNGVKCNTLKIAGESGGMVSLEAGLIGSGTRETSATEFAAALTESWMKVANCKVWMEDGSNISISVAPAQGAEDISSATPEDLKARLKSFEWSWDNKLQPWKGFGGGMVLADLDYVQRAVALKFTMLFSGATEINHFLDQNPLAVEFDLKGALIATTGTMYYGMQLIVPRFQLKTPPIPKGGVGDFLTCDMDCEIFEDGTNPASILMVYNAQAAYLINT